MSKPSKKRIVVYCLLAVFNLILLLTAFLMARDTGWAAALLFLLMMALLQLLVWAILKGLRAVIRKIRTIGSRQENTQSTPTEAGKNKRHGLIRRMQIREVRHALEMEQTQSVRRSILEHLLANLQNDEPFYDAQEGVPETVMRSYENLCQSFKEAAQTDSVREAEMQLQSVKTTYKTEILSMHMPFIQKPARVPSVFLPVEGDTLYFLPKYILRVPALRNVEFQVMPYAQMPVQVGLATLNAKTTDIPADCEKSELHYVRETKQGTPDLRYKKNAQYAVVTYGDCLFTQWNIHLLISKQTLAAKLAQAYEQHRQICMQS